MPTTQTLLPFHFAYPPYHCEHRPGICDQGKDTIPPICGFGPMNMPLQLHKQNLKIFPKKDQ